MMWIIEPKVRPTKRKNKERDRENLYRHVTYRHKRRGPYRGVVQALYEKQGAG